MFYQWLSFTGHYVLLQAAASNGTIHPQEVCFKEIYPSQLTVEKASKSDHLADHLDLTFIIDSGGKLSTRLYDKHDDFDFHIVNFLYLSSNIPSGPSYGVYISQLIRYA